MWAFRSEKIVAFVLDPSRAASVTLKTLFNLTLFVEYPELPMDNNLMENGIRPCALERNNLLGNHSIWGGDLAACIYSIIQTCLPYNLDVAIRGKMTLKKILSFSSLVFL